MPISLHNGKLILKEGIRKEDSLNILFAGDFCPRNRVGKYILDGESNDIISSIKPILCDKDLSIVNVEAALTRGGTPIDKHGPHIRVDPRCAGFLNAAGFDAACLANNHAGDYGPQSVMETIETLHQYDIKTAGAGQNARDAGKPLVVNVRGKNIGIFSCTRNMGGTAREDTAGVNPLIPRLNAAELHQISSGVDITIAIIHNGSEMYPFPSPRTVNICRSFVDAGVSAVVVIHAHCPQGIEIYKGCPIIYNLGNFLFDRRRGNLIDGRYSPDTFWWTGYMVRIGFADNRAAALEVIPYTFSPDARKIRLLDGDEKEWFMDYLEQISAPICDKSELKKLWNAWNDVRSKPGLNKTANENEEYARKIKKLQKSVIR